LVGWKGEIEIEFTNSMERKPWTSSVVEGPPMFMKTIAVGPLEPVCGTGATVALPLRHCTPYAESAGVEDIEEVARFAARVNGMRIAITRDNEGERFGRKVYGGTQSIEDRTDM